MDFTLHTYIQLLHSLKNRGYQFETFEKFNPQEDSGRKAILRHDVDDKPGNSYKTALIEHNLGIRGTYYFRIVKQSFNTDIIKKIASLGHEIGYHYEDLALAKGNIKLAEKLFRKHLASFDGLYPVKTICMHGSPLSKYDNRLMWKEFNYADFGIVKEPYFDIDFSKVLYLTDTGRRWDGDKVSVRDRELHNGVMPLSAKFKFHSTPDLIKAADEGILPDKIMLNFHPQRWTNHFFHWSKELVWQNTKNQVKKMIVKRPENILVK
jgi:hypothetical protein